MDVPLMRTIAMSGAVLALVLTVSSVWANNDFEALLGDLTFGQAKTENLTLDVAAQNAAETLKPVPAKTEGFKMPEAQPQLKGELTLVSEPIVALKDPIPAVQPEQIDTADVDFGMIFSSQDATDSALTSQPIPVLVGHRLHRCDVEACDEEIICRPHQRPTLPSSTILQYFRSNSCYSNVWDGYEQECRHHCGDNHKHIHGECDCFEKKSKRVSFHSPFRRDCNACESCDAPATACDR